MSDYQKGQDHDGLLAGRITPALSAEQWASGTWKAVPDAGRVRIGGVLMDPDELLRFIAACNAALPDSDPRKITRDRVKLLADVAASIRPPQDPDAAVETLKAKVLLAEFADALASYLQPEGA